MGRYLAWFLYFFALALPACAYAQANSQKQGDPPAPTTDEEISAKFAKIKRVYVESFGDDQPSKQAQAMVIDALTKSHRFIVTEKKETADAILKGVGLEKSSQELHASSEATSVSGAAGSHQGSISGSGGTVSGSSSGGFVARGAGIADSQASTETINDARMAVRLVSTDGDVLWSTTQESKGAKYKGASADVAEKVVKQLLWDLERLQSQSKQKSSTEKQ
jgi:curli biogenesis system outer membrane secretion channel CsgG